MKYAYLGSTGVQVSKLCFGTMTFGDQADEKMSKVLFNMARESGINFFDCANVYAKGESEKILGKLMASVRDQLVITTKVFFPIGEGINDKGCSRKHILKSINDSLLRLNTDYIDIFFLHMFDAMTSYEESFSVLNDLVHQGKINYIGVSNFSSWQIEKALSVCEKHGWQKIQCIQPMYNLVKRQAEVEILPMAKEEKLGVISYSPLGGGLLTGKYETGESLKNGRLMENDRYKKRYGEEWMHISAKKFCDFAKYKGYHPAALAVSWVAYNDNITAPIIGARNAEQLIPALESVNIELKHDLYKEISDLSPAPPPATDRSEMM